MKKRFYSCEGTLGRNIILATDTKLKLGEYITFRGRDIMYPTSFTQRYEDTIEVLYVLNELNKTYISDDVIEVTKNWIGSITTNNVKKLNSILNNEVFMISDVWLKSNKAYIAHPMYCKKAFILKYILDGKFDTEMKSGRLLENCTNNIRLGNGDKCTKITEIVTFEKWENRKECLVYVNAYNGANSYGFKVHKKMTGKYNIYEHAIDVNIFGRSIRDYKNNCNEVISADNISKHLNILDNQDRYSWEIMFSIEQDPNVIYMPVALDDELNFFYKDSSHKRHVQSHYVAKLYRLNENRFELVNLYKIITDRFGKRVVEYGKSIEE